MSETGLQPVENKSVGLSAIGTLDVMKKKLQENKEKHEFIRQFIDEIFQENVDFGKAIGAAGAKPVLLLPGAEKLCSHFEIHPEWKVDHETFEMLGSPKDTVCYICYLIDNGTGNVVGEGRGACVINERSSHVPARDTNGSIKIAKKRSHVDAVKNAFSLSERFTQDMDMVKSFIDEKQKLFEYVTSVRASCGGELSNKDFIVKICMSEIKKKTIGTMKELKMVSDAIEKYDYETGERIPDEING